MYNVYPDVQIVNGINQESWQYSDQCFIEVCDQLEIRLKNWTYCGEPEMILLQNSSSFDKTKPTILIGCAPCQGFSSNRKKHWNEEDDIRNSLIMAFVEIVKRMKPDVSLNTFTSFQLFPSFHNLFFSSILSLHHPTIRTHRSRQGKKEKVLQSYHEKKSRFERQLPVNQIGSLNF